MHDTIQEQFSSTKYYMFPTFFNLESEFNTNKKIINK